MRSEVPEVAQPGRPFSNKIAAQKSGKVTSKNYSLLGKWRMIRGIALMTWYRATGKISTTV